MKILLASSSSGSRGGGELYLLYLARALRELGHEAALWTSTHPRMDELTQLFAGIGPVHRSDYTNLYDRKLRTVSSYLDWQTPRRLARRWSEIPHDILHINKQNLEDGFELLRAAKLLPQPTACTIHLTQSAKFLGAKSHRIRDILARAVLRQYPGRYITVLDERARDLERFLGRTADITAIPNGVPTLSTARLQSERAATRRSLGVDENTPLVVAVGRMVPQKRPLLFLEIARKIAARLPETQFLWVGDGPLAPAWDAATRDWPAVRRLPWQAEVYPYLAAGDCFLHVAQYEGLPLAVLEAMAAGLPCLVTPNLKNELHFLDEANSLMISPDNDDWILALQNKSVLRLRGAAARRTIENGYSFLDMARSSLQVYQQTTPSH